MLSGRKGFDACGHHPGVLKPVAQIVASGLETLLKAAGGFEPGAIECAA
jgi:hypothetical protein